MGTAFSVPLADAGHAVRLVGTHLDDQWISSVRATGLHPKLKAKLPDSIVPLTHDQLGEQLHRETDLIVLGVSSAGIDWAVEQLGSLLRTPPAILMLTKGLKVQEKSIQILPHAVRDGLANYGIREVKVAAIGGPCIASELASRRDSSIVITSSDSVLLERIVCMLDVPYYHARTSQDVVGVEACAALKNFYAIAVGYSSGLSERMRRTGDGALMHNAAAGLFTQAIAEMEIIVSFMGGSRETVKGLAGAGDLYVTCQAGRNSHLGYLLGTGLLYREAKTRFMRDETVEGAELALTLGPALNVLFDAGRLDRSALPLASALIDAICCDLPLKIVWKAFY